MKLHVQVDERALVVEVPDDTLREAEEFFGKMDADMDQGWQMSREFVEHPDVTQRCQIAADKLLVALSSANETMVMLMAGYILKRLPKVSGVDINTEGEMMETQFSFNQSQAQISTAPPVPPPAPAPKTAGKLTKMEALDRAGREVTNVYKVGRVFRFAVLDPATGKWNESPAVDDEREAQAKRAQAFKTRFDELAGA